MPRPTKATVDYFPLDCKFGDTITALENIYGNDVFVIWIKTLQKLGQSNHHYIDVRSKAQWTLFYSRFKIDESRVREIFNNLAELDCIDKDLWSAGVIYSTNFVERIKDVYKTRIVQLMTRDEILRKIITPESPEQKDVGVSSIKNPINDKRNPQTKLNYTKVNNDTCINEYTSSFEKKEENELHTQEEEFLKILSGIEGYTSDKERDAAFYRKNLREDLKLSHEKIIQKTKLWAVEVADESYIENAKKRLVKYICTERPNLYVLGRHTQEPAGIKYQPYTRSEYPPNSHPIDSIRTKAEAVEYLLKQPEIIRYTGLFNKQLIANFDIKIGELKNVV